MTPEALCSVGAHQPRITMLCRQFYISNYRRQQLFAINRRLSIVMPRSSTLRERNASAVTIRLIFLHFQSLTVPLCGLERVYAFLLSNIRDWMMMRSKVERSPCLDIPCSSIFRCLSVADPYFFFNSTLFAIVFLLLYKIFFVYFRNGISRVLITKFNSPTIQHIPITMTSRSKEKVTAMFRKIFKSSSKEGEGPSKPVPSGSGSPARRLLRGCRDSVSPAAPPPGSPGFTTTKNSRKGTEETPCSKTVRTRRLMKEFRDLQKLQNSKSEPVFSVELVDDNLFEWHVRLYKVDTDSDLGNDMKELGITYILLHLIFPENFPFAPPFMRVISPRIEKGFVMEGGAICMELLTPRGWASAYTVEAVIMQFAASVVKGQGRIQRKTKGQKLFSRRSAEESFRSLVKTHEKYGWVTPSLADG